MSDSDAHGAVKWQILDNYNRRQEFEHELIDRKIRWMLTSQTILFTAYGLTLSSKIPQADADRLQGVAILVGSSSSLLTLIGVLMALLAKVYSWRQYQAFFGDHPPEPYRNMRLPWGANTRIATVSMVAELLMPCVFVGAWLWLWLG